MAEGDRAVAVCEEHRPVAAENELVCERCGEVLGFTVTVWRRWSSRTSWSKSWVSARRTP